MSAPSAALSLVRPPRAATRAPLFGSVLERVRSDLHGAVRRTGDDSWAIEIPTRSQRSQVIHVGYDNSENRISLRSVVGPFRANLGTSDLIRRNGGQVLGIICVEDLMTEHGARPFVTVRHTQVRTNDAADLRTAISLVGWAADDLERTLFARDVE